MRIFGTLCLLDRQFWAFTIWQKAPEIKTLSAKTIKRCLIPE
jgi:hypothetical protein